MIECFPISCLVDHQKVQNIIIIMEPKMFCPKLEKLTSTGQFIYNGKQHKMDWEINQTARTAKKHVRMLQNLRANTKWQILNFLT